MRCTINEKGGVLVKQNYQQMTDAVIAENAGRTPSLLLHACCAPCASAVLEYLAEHFAITLLFYNPNIQPEEEYRTRLLELERLVATLQTKHPVKIFPCEYDPTVFDTLAQGLEDEPERGARCPKCFEARLRKTAHLAKEHGFEYFTTTLSISPHKSADTLHEIGVRLSEEFRVSYLPSDFKKKGGYLRSIELSKQFGLYRQNYCGCKFSKR